MGSVSETRAENTCIFFIKAQLLSFAGILLAAVNNWDTYILYCQWLPCKIDWILMKLDFMKLYFNHFVLRNIIIIIYQFISYTASLSILVAHSFFWKSATERSLNWKVVVSNCEGLCPFFSCPNWPGEST